MESTGDTVSLTLTKEEIRIIFQALNEICNGLHFEQGEFETRMGTDKEAALSVMVKLRHAGVV